MARKCTTWFNTYVEYNADFEPPIIFSRWVALGIISIVTERKVWLPEGQGKIFPNLYIILNGPSGTGKTTAMREGLPFLNACGIEISAAKPTSAALLKAMSGSVKSDEQIGLHTPYVIWAEELPSFLGTDAYKTGMLADLTTLYDCPEPNFKRDLVSREGDDIPYPYVVLIGGATPQGIFDVLPTGATAQGFTARIMFVYSSFTGKRVIEKPWGDKQRTLYKALEHDLQEIASLRGPMKLSDVFKAYWADYYINRPEPENKYNDIRMQGYASREPFYAKKVSMLLSLAESDSMIIEAHHLEKALNILKEVDRSIAEAYSEMSPSVVVNTYKKIVRMLAKASSNTMLHGDLLRRFSYMIDAAQFKLAIDGLIQMGYIVPQYTRTGVNNTGHTKTYYKLTRDGGKYGSSKSR